MRIEAAVTSISWIPPEAVTGLTKAGFSSGVMHYDDPPRACGAVPCCQPPSGTWMTRVPQFCWPSVVWLDFAGMYSVASHAESPAPGTAKE